MVGYAVRGGMAVALGDPIGPPADVKEAIAGFRTHCQRQGWQTAFYQTLPAAVEVYRAAGFEVIRIGQEAVVDLHAFSLEGRANKRFRSAINHMTKLGQRAEVIEPPLSDELLAELRAVSDEWLTMMHGKEMRFSLGWFDDRYIRNCPVIVVRTEFGQVSAFANLIPEYQKNEATLDLMRRRQDAEPGTMDFLFTTLLLWCQARGYDTFNLGLSALSGVGESPSDPAAEKALHYVYDHINQFYNFRGLHAFKEKFNPNWEPRYLVFPSYASLPAVWTALARVGSGDDFLIDYLWTLFSRLKELTRRVVVPVADDPGRQEGS